MRNYLYLLLFIFFAPATLPGQIIQKRTFIPGQTITIKTANGEQTTVKAPQNPIQVPTVIRQQSGSVIQATPKRQGIRLSNFDQVVKKRTVSSNETIKGAQVTDEIILYVPKKVKIEKPQTSQRRMSYYDYIELNTQEDVDNFATLYPDCDNVGTLVINGDISSLSNINGLFGVWSLEVRNTQLNNLSDLNAWTSLGGPLVLDANYGMTTIELPVTTLGGLQISNMPNLDSLGFPVGLTEINGDVILGGDLGVLKGLERITRIWGNLYLAELPGQNINGLSGLTTINGDLLINNNTLLQNLNGLSNLQEVGFINLSDNPSLTTLGIHPQKMGGIYLGNMPSLNNLGNLTENLTETTTGSISLDNLSALTSISGLSKLTGVANLYVGGCPWLTNLNGLEGLVEAPGGFQLVSLQRLTDISALSNFNSVESGVVEIRGNSTLTNLNGLGALTKVKGLDIESNGQLSSLSGLNPNLDITGTGRYDLYIYQNPLLSVCSVPAICNYLSKPGVTPTIAGNGPGCSDLAAVTTGCAAVACTTSTYATWTGAISSDWNTPGNWSGGSIPDGCTVVTIPSGTPNNPVSTGDIAIGGLIMDGASLVANNTATFTVFGAFDVNNSTITLGQSYATLKVLNAVNPKLTFSTFTVLYGDLEISNFTGDGDFYGNAITAGFKVSDAPARTGHFYVFGNTIGSPTYGDSFYMTNNSTSAPAYLANANEAIDKIYGYVYIKNNSSETIYIGTGNGEPLEVYSGVEIKDEGHAQVKINKIAFKGGDYQTVSYNPSEIIMGKQGTPGATAAQTTANGRTTAAARQMGPTESGGFQIDSLYLRKDDGYLNFEQNSTVNRLLYLSAGSGAISSKKDKMLILGSQAIVTDDDPIVGSFVEGPMKKIGDAAFTFPLGTKVYVGGTPPYKRFKAPISISAPTEDYAEFVAEYIHENPGNYGYDTAVHAPGVSGILTDEFWMLTHERGTSNVLATLAYDQSRVTLPINGAAMQINGWDGSQWSQYLRGTATGDNQHGTVSTASPLTVYGPLALSSQNIRKPVATFATLVDSFVCRGGSAMVHFTLDTMAVDGSNFSIELSAPDGTFGTTNTIIGSKATNKSDSILITLPTNGITLYAHYRIRLVSSLQGVLSTDNLVIIPIIQPQATVTLTGPDSTCLNTGVEKYFISGKEAGATYNWTVNNGTYTIDNDTIYVTFNKSGATAVKVTAVNKCGNGPTVTKNTYVKPGTPTATPSLTNTGRWLYVSQPAPAQQVTTYKWFRDGNLMTGATGLSYYASESGEFTVQYSNSCGDGPASNAITFANASLPQTITFTDIPDKTYGDEAFPLPATSSVGLPIVYQLVSGPGNITEGIFTITGTGTVVVRASQPGDNVYDTAAPVTKTFVINKATQVIAVDSIADYIFSGSTAYIYLIQKASSGLNIKYESASPNVVVTGSNVRINGVGAVHITATQEGNANYLAADTVELDFCVRVIDLANITGSQYVCPGLQVVYRINKIPGLVYHWRLSDGTTYTSNADTAEISFATSGTYKLYVSATNPCGPETNTDSLMVTVMDGATPPGAPGNMLPANGSIDRKLPLVLSWSPGANALSYDLYLWEDGSSKPAQPYASNLTLINYTLTKTPQILYDHIYRWQVVSKSGCLQTNSAEQTFRLRKASDLTVTEVQAPLSVNTGQTITINWKVKNVGEGNTLTNESWQDAVFLSFDTIPNFQMPPGTNPGGWSMLDFPVRPLLVGVKNNVTALNAGEEYTNSINFTVPLNYSAPVYAYIITNYKGGTNAPPQSDVTNDTARASNKVAILPTPTPDLRVDTVLAPATTFSGSTVMVTYRVTNYGVLTPAGKNWVDKIYISKSPLFNKDQATLLKRPKANETYYPNAFDAIISNGTQLEEDSSYTRIDSVVIPNFISGTWFIHVVTNDGTIMYEGALAGNNTNNTSIQVILTPAPQFTITSLNVSNTTVSNGQGLNVNWSINNSGSYDNIEKNKGFYPSYYMAMDSASLAYKIWHDFHERVKTVGIPGNPDGPRFPFPTPPPIYEMERDSLSWGSSYWVDKVYLSTNPNGLFPGAATFLGEAKKGIEGLGYAMPDNITTGVKHIRSRHPHGYVPDSTISNVLRPGSNHTNKTGITIPPQLPAGEYYLYVQANATNRVFTYPDEPVVRRSDKIIVRNSDLTVPSVVVPTNITGGEEFTLSYSVKNVGSGDVPGSVVRKDIIYIGNSSVFNESEMTVLKTITMSHYVQVGASDTSVVTLKLPNDVSGTKYFFVKTNVTQSFLETTFSNNTSSAANSSAATAPPVDLAPGMVSVPSTGNAPGTFQLTWQLSNVGANTASGAMKYEIFMGCTTVYSQGNMTSLGIQTMSINLAAGTSVNITDEIRLDKEAYRLNGCFAKIDNSNAYFFVKVNTDDNLYEPGNAGNNTDVSNLMTLQNNSVDLAVDSIEFPDDLLVGRPYSISWRVSNIGNVANGLLTTYDSIFVAKDTVVGSALIPLARVYGALPSIQSGSIANRAFNVVIPKVEQGDYYVFVNINARKQIPNETNYANNINLLRNNLGTAIKVHISVPPLADLKSQITAAPVSVAVGQPLTVKILVSNSGDSITYPNKWTDELWLAKGAEPNPQTDIKLSGKLHVGDLNVGEQYEDSVTATIPLNLPAGNYMLLSYADAKNNVIETNDTNNIATKVITVYIPEPSDIIVENVSAPDTVFLGEAINNVAWQIRNISSNEASAVSTDGVYLSKNTTYDSSAILIGIKNKNEALGALSTANLSLSPVINNVPEGYYNIIVKTDILNNLLETDKTNNENVTATPVYVSVKELHLDITLVQTLGNQAKYYKLVVPDSLLGSTIALTVKSNDSLTASNEVYVGAGYIPSIVQSDYKFNTPNYGNQQLLLNDITAPVYYIAVSCVTPGHSAQDISLHAEVLPFAILNVQSNKGGNGGNVTVKVTGSLFENSMNAFISKGADTVWARQVYFINSTEVYVTLPLTGKATGIYNLSLLKFDSSMATLANSFSVVTPDNGGLYSGGGVNTGQTGPGTQPGCDPGALAGKNSQLVTELIVPEKVFGGWPFEIQIRFSNPTNMDVSMQTMILYNDLSLPMSLVPDDFDGKPGSLYIEFKETDGPPGVIRAGSSGTIKVYSVAPVDVPAHSFVKFQLK